MRQSWMAAPAAVVILAAGGCGGSSQPSLGQFKSGFQTNKSEFRQLGTDLGQAITTATGRTNAVLASEFASLAARARTQAGSLRKLKPPDRYRSQLTSLAANFDVVAGDLQAISRAATAGNASAAEADTRQLVLDAAKVKAADNALSSALGLPTS